MSSHKTNGERSKFTPKFSRLKKKLIQKDVERKREKHNKDQSGQG